MEDQLSKIVGVSNVSVGSGELYVYSYDMTETPPMRPAAVVMPETVDQVRELVLWANKTSTPLVPSVSGQNVGGLTIPQVEGAVIVDLKKMKRILQVDEEALYVLVEPGVTFGDLKKHLDEHHPTLRYAYPLAPPFTSVLANALLQGLCDLSTERGSMADFINGLEAVLPTSEVVRVGSGVIGDSYWFGRYPLPDLVGLFTGWQGMTGIITKMALQLLPKKPSRCFAALFSFGEHETTRMLAEMTRAEIIDEAACMSFPVVKMLLGVKAPVEQFEGEPDYGTMLMIRGESDLIVSEKFRLIQEIIERAKAHDSRQTLLHWDVMKKLVGDQANGWIDFPGDAFKVLTEHDGLTWVGTFIHPRNWGLALEGGEKIVEKHGFEHCAFLKPMNRMHYAEFKFIIRFPKDRETLERVRKCNEELLKFVLDLGAIPYKTPVWSAKLLHERIDPSFIKLVRRTKEFLDPKNIMNPGRWGL